MDSRLRRSVRSIWTILGQKGSNFQALWIATVLRMGEGVSSCRTSCSLVSLCFTRWLMHSVLIPFLGSNPSDCSNTVYMNVAMSTAWPHDADMTIHSHSHSYAVRRCLESIFLWWNDGWSLSTILKQQSWQSLLFQLPNASEAYTQQSSGQLILIIMYLES